MACLSCQLRPPYLATFVIDPPFDPMAMHAPPTGFAPPLICAVCGVVFYPKQPTVELSRGRSEPR